MKRAVVSFPLLLLVCAVALFVVVPAAALAAAPPPGSTAAFDAAMNRLVTVKHYPQGVESYLDSLGDTTIGFRLAGSPADDAAAAYVAAQFQAMGLANVRQEAVPVDAWDMQGAWVRVNGRTMTASTFDGVPPTNGNLSGELVYVGKGTLANYAAKDVKGKIVVINIELDDFWLNFPAALAGLNGAKGVIATYGKNTFPWYAVAGSLGANDGEYSSTYPPMVYISRANGAWLKSQLAAGPVTGTMRSDVAVTMHDFSNPDQGGLGYNVVGEITGTNPGAKAILVAAHHDAHFRAGLDDTGALSNMLTIAKAMKMSGYQPRRTIVFLATTGEEFGYTDCWFDWCAGAWWAAAVTHAQGGSGDTWTGPSGSLALMINLELMARKGATLNLSSSTALAPWFKAVAKASPKLLPNGFSLTTPISSWEDGWTFTAAGVPSLVMEAGGKNYDQIYHTTVETKALVDYGYLGQIGKLVYRMTRGVNKGLLPYRLNAQASDLAATVSGPELKAAGADTTTVDAAVKAVKDYRAATAAYEARKAAIPASHRAAVNAGLFTVEDSWNTHLTGLDIWDYQAYPFQQTLWDTEAMESAVGHLQANPVQKGAALEDLGNVAMTYYGTTFGPDVYQEELLHHLPDYALITWGGQVDRPWAVDVLPQIDEVNADQATDAVTDLQALIGTELAGGHLPGATPGGYDFDGLNVRLSNMTTALNGMTAIVKTLK